jgi:hypothetical protein
MFVCVELRLYVSNFSTDVKCRYPSLYHTTIADVDVNDFDWLALVFFVLQYFKPHIKKAGKEVGKKRYRLGTVTTFFDFVLLYVFLWFFPPGLWIF